MSYTIKENIARRDNYGIKRKTSDIKYIVIHYTGNDGDTDENNGKYFHNNIIKASSHYFVDGDSVTRSVPDNYIAYAVGGRYNTSGTAGNYYGKCTNANSLSVELCDEIKNGVVYPSAKTIENALALVRSLMAKYGVPQANVIRHYDVNGKSCPAYWCGSSAKTSKWKSEFWNKLNTTTSAPASKPSASQNGSKYPAVPFLVKPVVNSWIYRSQPKVASNTKKGYLKKGTKYTVVKVSGDWGQLKAGWWVYLGTPSWYQITK